MNLKMRRFDTGWTWEFVETKGGGWVAPDIAISEIREEDRAAAAQDWANDHRASYAETAHRIDVLNFFLPNPGMREMGMTFSDARRKLSGFYRDRPDLENVEHPTDAWGSELLTAANNRDNTATLFSIGPDKTAGTEDDLVCLVSFRPVFESGGVKYDYDETWRLPEGLGDVLMKFIDEDDEVEFSRVVKP